jgi:hypothetical protein
MVQAALRRVIQVSHRDGETRASVEDDFHHFRLRFTHDGRRVLKVDTEALRQPYSLCGRAGEELKAVERLDLSASVLAVIRRIDARQQCTHQFDLAAVAIAAAARRRPVRYEAVVTDLGDGGSEARLRRDGIEVLAWRVRDYAVETPDPYTGIRLGEGFTNWAATHLDEPAVESALVMRRAVFISRGRRMQAELNELGHARGGGGCWVQQPERAAQALRVSTSVRTFSEAAPPGVADRAWLAYGDDADVSPHR